MVWLYRVSALLLLLMHSFLYPMHRFGRQAVRLITRQPARHKIQPMMRAGSVPRQSFPHISHRPAATLPTLRNQTVDALRHYTVAIPEDISFIGRSWLYIGAIVGGLSWSYSHLFDSAAEESSTEEMQPTTRLHESPAIRGQRLHAHNEALIQECFTDFSIKRSWASYIDEIASTIERDPEAFKERLPDYDPIELAKALRTIEQAENSVTGIKEIANVLWDYRDLLPDDIKNWRYISLGYYLKKRLGINE